MAKRFKRNVKVNPIINERTTLSTNQHNSSQDTPVEELEGSEGATVIIIGNTLIAISILISVISVFVLGKGKVDTGYLTISKWQPAVVFYCIIGGFNGVFCGFLLSKVGRILSHLEALRRSK